MDSAQRLPSAGELSEAKKLTTFEYLIKTRKEESSKHQAARKDPCTQMEDGFLQQGDGALGSSAQGLQQERRQPMKTDSAESEA
ncbi:probable palmitoyltransferase ZDHHC11B isoform X14 [Macaca fascicularis]|uniref:probable palmitoyltransferase ZDHHC11B isoform X14 n=1 Tax=Macaca fascicularis TaxID=9541 RepID=UPI003D157342